jgi:integrase
MNTAIDGYLAYCQAAGMSAGTIKIKRSKLTHATRELDLLTCTENDLVDYLARQNWRPETRRSARSHLRGFYTWAVRHGLRADNPSAYLLPVKVPHGQPKPATDDAMERALAVADVTLRAILLLGAYAGLRNAEIASLRIKDVEATRLRVTGKGGRVRMVHIHPELHEALQAQIAKVRPNEYVFPGRFGGTHIGTYYVWQHVKEATGGTPPHHLRHRFATRAYRHTRDLRAVQQLLGHSSPTTTARYVGVDDDAMVNAVLGVA